MNLYHGKSRREIRVTMPTEKKRDEVPSPRGQSETESAITDIVEDVAALGKKVIHIGGRPATEQVLEMARIEPDHHVLDAGCGVGTTAIEIANRFGCQVTAVDISPDLVERARRNVRANGEGDAVTVTEGDILDLEFVDDTFDRVIVEAVTMYLDRDRATSELVRVCKPGGYVIDQEAYFARTPTEEACESNQFLHPGLDLDEDPDGWADRYRRAGLVDIEYVSEPVDYFNLGSLVRDEGLRGVLTMLGRFLRDPAARRERRRSMPHEQRIEPFMDYFVLAGRKSY